MKARVTIAALSIAALALASGCKGDQGPVGPPGPPGPGGDAGPGGVITVPSNADTPTDATNAAWAALQPQITIQSVTIASPPVVKFQVTDATTGAGIAGLGNTSLASGAKYPSLANLSFAIAKLVKGTPSRWVSYIVTTVPTCIFVIHALSPNSGRSGRGWPCTFGFCTRAV